MKHLLPNIVWHTLVSPHAKYAAGTSDARRYASGFSPIVGFANPERPNFDALAPYCEPDEHFYCDGLCLPGVGFFSSSGRKPAGGSIEDVGDYIVVGGVRVPKRNAASQASGRVLRRTA